MSGRIPESSEGRTYASVLGLRPRPDAVRSPRVAKAEGYGLAIYHLKTKPMSRSGGTRGRLAVACAAYRSGERLWDERRERWHDYSRRRDDITGWIQAPEQAPEWAADREQLWNRVEHSERRKDSRIAREVQVALPAELDREQQNELVRSYVKEHFVEAGMVADVNIHRGDAQNPHAHIMLTTREVGEDGFGKKVRSWDSERSLREWREGWERHANRELERSGSEQRISCRSYKDQRLDRTPTKHEGPHRREMEEQGISTAIGTHNRKARKRNLQRERSEHREQRQRQGQSRGRDQGREHRDHEPEIER